MVWLDLNDASSAAGGANDKRNTCTKLTNVLTL